jgi:hypothetical protein
VIDPELVTRKMVLIVQDLSALEPIAGKALADYLVSPSTRSSSSVSWSGSSAG